MLGNTEPALRHGWHVVAASDEVGRDPVQVWLLGAPWALVRLPTPDGATRLVAGVNLAREKAYRALLARGLRVDFVGVAMQSGNEPAFNRPDVLALDDWR